jgi:hypothetical protein
VREKALCCAEPDHLSGLVFPVLGQSLAVVRQQQPDGLSIPQIRLLARQLLLALDFLAEGAPSLVITRVVLTNDSQRALPTRTSSLTTSFSDRVTLSPHPPSMLPIAPAMPRAVRR